MTDLRGGVWSELVGQDRAIEVLRSAAAKPEAMTHAWLITGPPGSGRSNAARAFAAALLSPDSGETMTPEAQRALNGTHESMTVMSTQKSLITIDEVRELVQAAQSAPVNAPWRVMIIEDADRMAERTSNVLLKSIEEPPPSTVWVLCAPSPQDVLTTIRSRCRNVNLRIPPATAVAQLLHERDGVDTDTALWAASAAQNHIGRARYLAKSPAAQDSRQRILEIPRRLTSLGSTVRLASRTLESATESAEEKTKERNEREREQLLATLGIEAGKNPPASARAQIKRLEDEQKRRAQRARNDELDSILLELLSLYRDVLMCHLGQDEGLINSRSRDWVDELVADSDPVSTLKRIEILNTARHRLQTNTSPLLIVEAAFIGLSNPWLIDSLGRP